MSMTSLDAAKCALNWVSLRWSKDQDSLKNVFDPVLHDPIFRNQLYLSGYGKRPGSGMRQEWDISQLRGAPIGEMEQRQWSPASDKPWPIERVKITRVALKVLSLTKVELKLQYTFMGPFDLETYGMVEVYEDKVGFKSAKEAGASAILEMVQSKEIWTAVSEKVQILIHPASKKIAGFSCTGDVEQVNREDREIKFEDNTAKFAAMVEYWKKDPSSPLNCKFSILSDASRKKESCDAILRWDLPLNIVRSSNSRNNRDTYFRNERQHRLKIVDNKITEVVEQDECREIKKRKNDWGKPLGEGSSSEEE